MFVCICFAVTDAKIAEVVAQGATSVEEVTRACRAGGDCGSCHDAIREQLGEAASCRRPHRALNVVEARRPTAA